jgi:large subunit ribosomal protein LP2
MRHLAAYLLLQTGGKANPTAKDIRKLLGTVGIEADDDRLESLLAEVSGKDINAVRAQPCLSVITSTNDSVAHC